MPPPPTPGYRCNSVEGICKRQVIRRRSTVLLLTRRYPEKSFANISKGLRDHWKAFGVAYFSSERNRKQSNKQRTWTTTTTKQLILVGCTESMAIRGKQWILEMIFGRSDTPGASPVELLGDLRLGSCNLQSWGSLLNSSKPFCDIITGGRGREVFQKPSLILEMNTLFWPPLN